MKNITKKSLDLVIPIYNQERQIPLFLSSISHLKFDFLDVNYIFVNNRSKDASLKILYDASKTNKHIKIVNLIKNFGHEPAIQAGIKYSEADYVGVLDILDIKLIDNVQKIYSKLENGFDVVRLFSTAKNSVGFTKKIVFFLLNKILNKYCDTSIPGERSFLTVFNKKVINVLQKNPLYIKKLNYSLSLIGIRNTAIFFSDDNIVFPKKDENAFSYFIESIFIHSNAPLKLSFYLGGFILLFSFLATCVVFFLKLFTPYTVPGISAVIVSVLVMGAFQIILLGIIGQYIGRLLSSTDHVDYLIDGVKNLDTNDGSVLLSDEDISFEREEFFHDNWADSTNVDHVMVDEFFEACTSPENRYIINRLGDIKNKKILELGCGLGEASVYFAKKGADVTATDISGEMVQLADKVAKKHGVKVNTAKCFSHEIPFENETFDVVYAANVLHHVDLEMTLIEVNRVLKKGGAFVSWDPLAHNPLINIYRKMASEVRTDDEHPLRISQLKLFKKHFSKVEYTTTWFFTLWIFIKFYFIDKVDPNKERYWKKILDDHLKLKKDYSFLESIDNNFLRVFPFLKKYCWNIVIFTIK